MAGPRPGQGGKDSPEAPQADGLGRPWTPSLKRAERGPSTSGHRATCCKLKQVLVRSRGIAGTPRDTEGDTNQGHTAAWLKANRARRQEYHSWEERQSGGRRLLFCFSPCLEQLSSSHRGSHAGEGSRKTGKLSHSPRDTRCHWGSAQPPLRGSFSSCALTASAHCRACPRVRPGVPSLGWHRAVPITRAPPPTLALITRASLPCHLRSVCAAVTAHEPSCGLLFSAAQQAFPWLSRSSSCRS